MTSRLSIEDIMRVAKWGNSLAVRLPKALVETLALKAGDELEVVDATRERLAVAKDERRKQALERLASMRIALPADYRFDREEANARPATAYGFPRQEGRHARRQMGK
jgi:antitoxin MazE